MTKEPIYKYKMKVRDYELDAQSVVNNANYQHYYEVTRHEFLENCGVSFIELHNLNIETMVYSVSIKYRKPLLASDEFYCTIESLEKKGIRYFFNQKIIRISDNTTCSEARIEVVCVTNGKPIRPDLIDKVFERYIQ